MYGVVSLLDDEHAVRIEKVWGELRRRFGVRYVGENVNIPHISHHISEDYDLPRLRTRLAQIGETAVTIRVRTAGLGLFMGDGLTIYVAVVRSPNLSHYQAQVWAAGHDTGRDATDYYRPERWVPHITLAQRDIDRENIGEVMAYLSQFHFIWGFPVTKLALIEHNHGPAKVLETYQLQKVR